MNILNVGSLNIDRVYAVDHISSIGETISANTFEIFCGGKGLNQSIALARAGAHVFHAGAVGVDGDMLLDTLSAAGVDTDLVQQKGQVSGHAILQVDRNGQNSIIVYSGANGELSMEYIDDCLRQFSGGDLLLIQNEVSNVSYAIQQAKKRDLLVAFNPSPITPEIETYPLEQIDYLLVNEIEGAYLAGKNTNDPEVLLDELAAKFPTTTLVLTLGDAGVAVHANGHRYYRKAYTVPVVDTTAAGDTFSGYFLAGIAQNLPMEKNLERAVIASAIAVSRKGASTSIPTLSEVERLEKHN